MAEVSVVPAVETLSSSDKTTGAEAAQFQIINYYTLNDGGTLATMEFKIHILKAKNGSE